MGFKNRWAELKHTASTPDDYGHEESSSSYKAKSALYMLYASDYGYHEWKDIGIAFKAAGGTLEDWLAWCSIDASNYEEHVARQLFKNVSEDGPITANSLWKRAWDAGWDWHERYSKLPKVEKIPEPREFDSGDAQAIAQLEAMFEPDEYVCIVTAARADKDGKLKPANKGRQYRRADLCDAIRERGLEAAIGGYNKAAGVWLRVNPMDGKGANDSNVSKCRNTLVESDDMPLKDQERMLFELNLPIVCVTSSGGKSLHAVVKVDADGPNHFRDRVRYLHNECGRSGMSIDEANKNPSRLTRLAGVSRGDREQTLMHVGIGAKDFASWMAQEHDAKLVYDYGIVPMDMENEPVLEEVLVDGVMRRGDKMCVAGASKSYKSFALIQLAIATACGGKWFGWQCKQGRVLYINCELRGESFRKRVWEVSKAMPGTDRATIQDRMDVWNMRGRVQPLVTCKEHIIEQANTKGYDIVIFDPVYKVFNGDENNAHDVSEFMLALDEIAMRLHASIVYCHHHSKGYKGDVSAQDRFSGSGVFARDCDELVDISPLNIKDHSMDEWGYKPDATAWRIETVLRDFAPKFPLDAVYEYPVHHIDTTGYLGEFKIYSQASVGGTNSGQQRQRERDARIEELEAYCIDYYGDPDSIPITSADLSGSFGVSSRTITNWANKSNRLRVENVNRTNFVVLK